MHNQKYDKKTLLRKPYGKPIEVYCYVRQKNSMNIL